MSKAPFSFGNKEVPKEEVKNDTPEMDKEVAEEKEVSTPEVKIQVTLPKEAKKETPTGYYNPKNKLIVRKDGVAIPSVNNFLVTSSEEDIELCEYFVKTGILEKR